MYTLTMSILDLEKSSDSELRGQKNQRMRAILKTLRGAGCDPFKELAEMAMDPATDRDSKIKILTELAQYIAPKRRAASSAADEDDVDKTPRRVMVLNFVQNKDGTIVEAPIDVSANNSPKKLGPA